MESMTKNRQDKAVLGRMVEKVFAPVEMTGYQELTEGYYNVAYALTLSDGREVILKVAPRPDVRIMSYERNIMRSEVDAMWMVADDPDIPAPKVLGYDDSCSICDSPYFFMEKLSGSSLNAIHEKLSEDEISQIHMQSGKILQKVNQIRCPAFGYPGQSLFQGDNWYLVFRRMLEAGIGDAEAGGVDLKISVPELWDMLERDKNYFDEITQPYLVHWDCWDGNIFTEHGKITGIIDWERCLWADPLMEVGFRTFLCNTSFMKGYGMEKLSDREYRRALWYDVYMMILVSLECEYRKYDTMEMYDYAVGVLQKQVKELQTV